MNVQCYYSREMGQSHKKLVRGRCIYQEMLFQLDHRSEHDKILSQIQLFLVDEVCMSLSLVWMRIYFLS